MRRAAVTGLLAAALLAVGGGARAADQGAVTATVVANPLTAGVALSPASVAAGAPVTVTATATNLGAAALGPVELTLRVDSAGLHVAGGAVRTLPGLAGNGAGQATWSLCGLQPGNYVLLVEAASGPFEAESDAQLLAVTAGSPTCPDDANASVGAGGTATTDAEGDGATPADPVETSVTSPQGGIVSIVEQPADASAPSGLVVLGWSVEITAPAATPGAPLEIRFELHSSLLPGGTDPLAIELRRDGLVVAGCPGDPCLASRALQPDGDLELVVRTSAASTWTFGTTYPFAGFFAPVGNPPTVNVVNAGAAVPVKFGLGGDRGLGVLADGFPASARIACDTSAPLEPVTETTTAGGSSLTYDAATDRYVYVWKTDPGWGQSCRRLVLRLVDGTEHALHFSFR